MKRQLETKFEDEAQAAKKQKSEKKIKISLSWGPYVQQFFSKSPVDMFFSAISRKC